MVSQTVAPPITYDPPPPATAGDSATRYLSVGAYVDPFYRDRCLREVYHRPRRFVAPSYGFDLVTVLWHCLRARRLAIGRDASILLALLAVVLLDWRAFAAVLVALAALRTTRPAKRAAGERFKQWRDGTRGTPTRSSRGVLAILLGWAAAWATLAVLAVVLLSSRQRPLAALAAVAVLFALPTVFALWRQKRIEEFSSHRAMPRVRENRRLRDIDSQRDANTVVYSDFEPFIGSGDIFSTWGFAVRLVRKQPEVAEGGKLSEGRREFDEPPFTAEEIVSYVRHHLRRLTTGDSETRIPELTVTDRVFLSAREDGERSLHTGPDRMSEIIRNPTQPARHYLACQVVSWGGEVVTTVHVHIAVQGRSLYLQVTATSMAPCNERYRVVDLEGGRGPRAWIRALGSGIRETPRTITLAPKRLLLAWVDALGLHDRRRRRSRRATDRGALVSVRQFGTRDVLRNFTQEEDVQKFRRLIENRVYAHVLDFLDEHDVDTTEYRARSASVLNVGVINNAGDVKIDGDVAGSSSPSGRKDG